MTGEKLDCRALFDGLIRYSKDQSADGFIREVAPSVPTDDLTVEAACGVAAMWAMVTSEHNRLHRGKPIGGATLQVSGDDEGVPEDMLPVVNGLRMLTAYSNGDDDTARAVAAAAGNASGERVRELFVFLVNQFVEDLTRFKACQAAAVRS